MPRFFHCFSTIIPVNGVHLGHFLPFFCPRSVSGSCVRDMCSLRNRPESILRPAEEQCIARYGLPGVGAGAGGDEVEYPCGLLLATSYLDE